MFAYAVAKEFNIDFEYLNKFEFASLEGRNRIVKSVKTTIFDESYNASPESVKACIETLIQRPNNLFIILGSMKELGEETIQYHEEIFDLINKSRIEKCLFICDERKEIYFLKKLKDKKKFIFLNNIKNVPETINKITKKGDSILVKGSRTWHLEEIIGLID